MPVYLLHFSKPYKHCRHYLGLTKDMNELRRRIRDHRSGNGTGLTRAAVENGITLILAQVWPDGDREFEVKMKKQLGASRFCPICQLEEGHELSSHRSPEEEHPQVQQIGDRIVTPTPGYEVLAVVNGRVVMDDLTDNLPF